MKKTCAAIAALAWWTIIDEFRQRSVVIFFAACAAFMFVMRGCYQASYVVNGEALDAATIVSQATFHVVAAGVMMLAALMAMRIFKRERDDGTQAYLLSRPIARSHYLTGKVAGLWLGSAASMLALHGVLCLMAFLNAHVVSPGYLTASLLCSVNLLLVVLAVMALSLWIPDFLAFLAILGGGGRQSYRTRRGSGGAESHGPVGVAAVGRTGSARLTMVEGSVDPLAEARGRSGGRFFTDRKRVVFGGSAG